MDDQNGCRIRLTHTKLVHRTRHTLRTGRDPGRTVPLLFLWKDTRSTRMHLAPDAKVQYLVAILIPAYCIQYGEVLIRLQGSTGIQNGTSSRVFDIHHLVVTRVWYTADHHRALSIPDLNRPGIARCHTGTVSQSSVQLAAYRRITFIATTKRLTLAPTHLHLLFVDRRVRGIRGIPLDH